MRKALWSLLFASLVVIGCNNSAPEPKTPEEAKPTSAEGSGDKPVDPAAGMKVKKTVNKPGKGPKAEAGDSVYVTYEGKLKSGKVFDSSEKSGGNPFNVTLGAGQVIKGWEQGLEGAQKGEELTLDIPYQLAYGEAGSGETIPPKSDLIFDITVHAVLKQEDSDVVVRSKPSKVGTGRAVKEGDKITVDYTVKLVNGKEVDSTADQGQAFTFTVGEGETLPGIDAGVVGMKLGEKRELLIPPRLGLPYGNAKIPGQSPILVDIEIKSIK
jgi:peptidylprolyl isomerase